MSRTKNWHLGGFKHGCRDKFMNGSNEDVEDGITAPGKMRIGNSKKTKLRDEKS